MNNFHEVTGNLLTSQRGGHHKVHQQGLNRLKQTYPFNTAKYKKEDIDSKQQQSNEDFEVLCDDHSVSTICIQFGTIDLLDQ